MPPSSLQLSTSNDVKKSYLHFKPITLEHFVLQNSVGLFREALRLEKHVDERPLDDDLRDPVVLREQTLEEVPDLVVRGDLGQVSDVQRPSHSQNRNFGSGGNFCCHEKI